MIGTEMSVDNYLDHFIGKINNYDCKFELKKQSLVIELVDRQSFQKYTVQIDDSYIKESRYLNFFFISISEVYHYLITSFNSLVITKNGSLMFSIELNLGSISKTYECVIETVKEQVDPNEVFNIKFHRIQDQVKQLLQQNHIIRNNFERQMQEQKQIQNKIEEYQKILYNKDQVINQIFHELKQIKKWKQEFQKDRDLRDQNKFIKDDKSPHSKRFYQIGNVIKKVFGGSWDNVMNKIPISRTQITKYRFRQIKAGSNGSFMYGIATEEIKGVNRAQDSKYFIGYYELTGNIYEQGASRKGGPKIRDEDTIMIVIDPRKWKIYWYIEGKKEAQATIGLQMKTQNLFLSFIVFNNQAELQFI